MPHKDLKTLNGQRVEGEYMCIREPMFIPRTNLIHDLPFSSSAIPGSAAKASESECEVIRLFEQFRNPLLRYVVSRGLSLQDGEEIIQEVFLALFRHLQLGRSRRNLRGWVFRVAHNLALKQHNANKKDQATLDSDEATALRQPDAAPNPEEQAASRQRGERMQAVLRALPEQDRCCLYLRAEGLRYREIAAALGISLGAVSIALTRSLERMGRVDQG
jgi:RNA polymerase sigma-70 factor, ECF subfamily